MGNHAGKRRGASRRGRERSWREDRAGAPAGQKASRLARAEQRWPACPILAPLGRLQDHRFSLREPHRFVLNRSKFAVFVAVLLLLGALVPRPMAAVGSVSRDQQRRCSRTGCSSFSRARSTRRSCCRRSRIATARRRVFPMRPCRRLTRRRSPIRPDPRRRRRLPRRKEPARRRRPGPAVPRQPDPQQEQLFPENRSANRRA